MQAKNNIDLKYINTTIYDEKHEKIDINDLKTNLLGIRNIFYNIYELNNKIIENFKLGKTLEESDPVIWDINEKYPEVIQQVYYRDN